MPNIDTTSIDGFDGMTAEQKVDALLKLEIPEKVDLTGYIPKAQFDKTASELAEAKKQVKARMTEDEAAKAQADADRAELESKYNELLKRSTIAEHTAKFLSLGYEEKLAKATAEALFDGDMEKVFANQQAANAAMEKKIRADLVKKDPRPGGAGGADDGKAPNIDLAIKLGKAKADALNAANEGIKKYLNR